MACDSIHSFDLFAPPLPLFRQLSPPNVCVDALVFAIEFLTSQRMEDDVESMSVVLDMAGYGYKNLDMDTVKAALVIVQEYYPER